MQNRNLSILTHFVQLVVLSFPRNFFIYSFCSKSIQLPFSPFTVRLKFNYFIFSNFGEHKVAVDFCSDRFNLYFINRKKENIEVAARSSSPTSKSENDQGSSSPSSSRDRQNLHDPLQTRSSVEHHTNQEDQENNA